MKTEFYLQSVLDYEIVDSSFEKISIIGATPKYKPYVIIETERDNLFIKDKDLERFARNILKALGKN